MNPIEKMINDNVRCTVCGAAMGGCQCWTKCRCGWSYRRGGKCANPEHGGSGNLEVVASTKKLFF